MKYPQKNLNNDEIMTELNTVQSFSISFAAC